MQQPDLTRRQVLSGIAVTGGAGALTGRGTAAIFTDEETFTNNALTASTSSAGVVELDVTVDSLDSADGLNCTISVPDLTNNNPSYIWVQPATCPEPIDEAEQVDVELRIDRDGGDSVVIVAGTLKSVINELREDEGAVLRSVNDDPRCFEPGESVDLVLEVISSATDADFDFELEFYAEQCRYNTGTSTPFPSLGSCGGTTTQTVNAISWIAFCSENNADLDPIPEINATDGDEPTSVDWKTESDVDYVTVKSGQNFTVYNYSDSSSTTDGTVMSGNDGGADYYDTDPPNNVSSTPCNLVEKVDGSPSDIETSVKLDWDEENKEFISES
ncbi:hypothetical protein EXE44_16100 [Halorubrum sp. SS7]|uniref:hypothetical protein n=1 Tax=unclassified Halorubrum TaxID=2642239 RepID=UPI0010F5ABCE|nr:MULTISPECIES: hypothetical protein [unclassified Halorubrum]TKX55670.1 hypothetical protein EXE44_16100 [Halorubrum sp. SS7]TKX56131.1 hypothetical protein EXE42_00805 [Halorubrum sp. SP3]TKX71149.1 hypothetical protein EXE45_02710 [Halorubrum sp. SP9]